MLSEINIFIDSLIDWSDANRNYAISNNMVLGGSLTRRILKSLDKLAKCNMITNYMFQERENESRGVLLSR